MKQIYIINGSGTSGKDTFVEKISKYMPCCKYSIIDLCKEAATVLGCNVNDKTEKTRKFLSDLKYLSSDYNYIPFKDVISVVIDFKCNLVDYEVLFIDMRDPDDIKRAVELLDAKTILVRRPSAIKITSNHADANVENYNYDYIIENNGTIEQLENIAKMMVKEIKSGNTMLKNHKPVTYIGIEY